MRKGGWFYRERRHMYQLLADCIVQGKSSKMEREGLLGKLVLSATSVLKLLSGRNMQSL